MFGISIPKEVEKTIIKVAKKKAHINNVKISDISYYLSVTTNTEDLHSVKVYPYIKGKRQASETVKEFIGKSMFLKKIENRIIEIATQKANKERIKPTDVGYFLIPENKTIKILPYINKKYGKPQTIKWFLQQQ